MTRASQGTDARGTLPKGSMGRLVVLSIDAMGGDLGPAAVVAGLSICQEINYVNKKRRQVLGASGSKQDQNR